MLNDNSTPKHLWVEAVNIACYLQNIIYIRPILKMTPNKLWKERKPIISYIYPFGCQCFILNTKDNLGKFDSQCDNGTLFAYSETSKAYKVYNSRTSVVKEAIHVRFNDTKPDTKTSKLGESFVDISLDKGIGPLTKSLELDESNQAT